MPTTADPSHLQSEGDLNSSPRRAVWASQAIEAETQKWLDEAAKYFLHQSLSTPCLNVLAHCEGIYLEDLQGNRYDGQYPYPDAGVDDYPGGNDSRD